MHGNAQKVMQASVWCSMKGGIDCMASFSLPMSTRSLLSDHLIMGKCLILNDFFLSTND